ncbi:hypothetical protein EBT25_14375 [bacterium]|nr:hypothetical protein [bacterium]
MTYKKTLIFGAGKVGVATNRTLQLNADFHDPVKGVHMENAVADYDLCLICTSSLVNGPHDHSSIIECLDKLRDGGFQGLVAIRCTVSPAYMDMFINNYPALNIVHFPEFMKQRDDVYMDTPWIVVLGGNSELVHTFGAFLVNVKYCLSHQLHFVTAVESALIKLHQNAGLAIKVMYANMMYEACQAYGADYERVRHGACADGRVGLAHTVVPGEHGYGFGGHCLPKDVTCLANCFDDRNFWKDILKVNTKLHSKNSLVISSERKDSVSIEKDKLENT